MSASHPKALVTVHAGIVNKDVNPAPGLVDPPEHLGNGVGIGDVRLERDRFAASFSGFV